MKPRPKRPIWPPRLLDEWAFSSDAGGDPVCAMAVDDYLRDSLRGLEEPDPADYLYRPAVFRDPATTLEAALPSLAIAAVGMAPVLLLARAIRKSRPGAS